jgi:hypothetical protein
MLGSAVEPVTMATRPENLCAEVRPGDVGSADAMSGILSQVELSRHVVSCRRRNPLTADRDPP